MANREDLNSGKTQVGVRPGENTFLKLKRGYSPQSSEVAKNVRNTYMHYFNNEGSVSWQEKFI
ncbi:hypothetical protein NQ314_015952 [Rhamnusium bicolor]|uniref:Uncharacterized protein n=1 Tax=Rhamnusium bicolor TaxID=1586634 RepID=A0AAV8WY43_9CUCU|nr:hypothetical protein NQ314_015952 [Rhamnusium bicolor]